jgi:hypothetical protein
MFLKLEKGKKNAKESNHFTLENCFKKRPKADLAFKTPNGNPGEDAKEKKNSAGKVEPWIANPNRTHLRYRKRPCTFRLSPSRPPFHFVRICSVNLLLVVVVVVVVVPKSLDFQMGKLPETMVCLFK